MVIGRRCAASRLATGRSGGSLIEVMISLVILGVGLLALQSLALAAGAGVAGAERTTRSTATAIDALESALHKLLLDSLPVPATCVLPGGRTLEIAIDADADAGEARVRVRLTDDSGTGRSMELTGFVRAPERFTAGSAADACS